MVLRLLTLLLLASSCYGAELAPCKVTCGAARACPNGAACGSDGYCHLRVGESCSGLAGRDARAGDGSLRDAGSSPDAADGGPPDDVPPDSWRPITTVRAPAPRRFHSAVWTGTLMIVWGGASSVGLQSTGGRYDPRADGWTATSQTNAPVARRYHTAVWTTSEMIIWGGDLGSGSRLSARYDPIADTWTPVTLDAIVSSTVGHSAVWSGSEMIIWGGGGFAPFRRNGGRYDPRTDTWRATSMSGAPTGRAFHSAVWAGSEMIIWGGRDDASTYLDTGGRYDPRTDTWRDMAAANAPTPRVSHSALWTDRGMFVVGGETPGGFATARYEPVADRWTALSEVDAVHGTEAAWTGAELVVWNASWTPPGGRYDLARDHWRSISTIGAPGAGEVTSVWTGADLILWGTVLPEGTQVGGRYRP